jgi:hypothetical protein
MKLPIRLTLMTLIICASAVRAQPGIDVTKHDMHPLIQLHVVGANIAGDPFEGDVFIYRGGPTFLAFSSEFAGNRVARGVATPQELMALNQTLAAARVGQQSGNCGEPIPDATSEITLSWYGAKGRLRTIPVGGIYTSCPADVVRIFDATCAFIWEVLGPSPEICQPPVP